MTRILVFKLLRDIRWPLAWVGLLLVLFQLIWAQVTNRITQDLLSEFEARGISRDILEKILFKGQGKLIQTIMGGESIRLDREMDMLSIGYVHPVTQAIFCIWAIGRAAGALAGEIDKGTMELLLGQAVPRSRVVLSHLLIDALTLPLLCVCMIAGTWLGANLVGLKDVELYRFWGGLASVAALMFAVSGITMACSACGRSRTRVLSFVLGVFLVQFLVNLIGQLWSDAEFLRPATVFYYYQAQSIVLLHGGNPLGEWSSLATLLGVGAAGYAIAFVAFRERDLPAPL